LSDVAFQVTDFWRFAPGYGALFFHGMSSTGLEHTLSVLSPSLGTTFTTAASVLGASIFALPLYLFRTLVVWLPFPPTFMPILIPFFKLDFPTTPDVSLLSLASLPIIAYSLLCLTPFTAQFVKQQTLQPQHFGLSYPALLGFSFVFGITLFQQSPSWTDAVIAGLLFFGEFGPSIVSLM
jgi:zinc transporter 5/7